MLGEVAVCLPSLRNLRAESLVVKIRFKAALHFLSDIRLLYRKSPKRRGRLRPTLRGGGQRAVGFVARRQCMFPYAILLASRPQPLSPPSILICRCDRALGRIRTRRSPISWPVLGLYIN